MVTQREIARRLGIDVSSVNKILNRRKGAKFKPETVKRVMKTAERLGFNFGRLKFDHSRRHLRQEVRSHAEVEVILSNGSVFARGTATIVDISLGGALLSDLKLEGMKLPTGPFWIALRPKAGKGLGPELRGQIVRINRGKTHGYGVAFDLPSVKTARAADNLTTK